MRFFAECWRSDGAAVSNGDDELLEVFIRGWDIGVKVTLRRTADNRDRVTVIPMGGSNNPRPIPYAVGVVWEGEPDPKDRRETSTP